MTPDNSPVPAIEYTSHNSRRLAYRLREGNRPTIVFLGGFRSDMEGSKAHYLDTYAARYNLGYVRFDYSGHGASDGIFEACVLSDWLHDTLHIIDTQTQGDIVLVGSSMGGWLAVLAALQRPQRIKALIGIAAACDFTQKLMWARMSAKERETIGQGGTVMRDSDYGDAYPITAALINDGTQHCVLDASIALSQPIHLLHGMQDVDVPYEYSLKLAEAVASNNVTTHLIKDGDHRLSRHQGLRLLPKILDMLTDGDGAAQ